MGEAGKHQQGAMAGVFSLITTRRTKLFAYGFVLSFVGYTAFLAFSLSSSTSSPWFNTLFTSSSISSSIAPYRSQFSSLVFQFFPNSSSPSSETPISTQITKNQTEIRAGSAENGVGYLKEGILADGSRGDGVSGKNQTVNEVGSAANVFPVKSGTNEVVGSKKNGVLAGKKYTGSGTGLQGKGVPVTKQTKKVPGSEKNGASMKNQTKAGNGSEKVVALAGKNQTGSGTDLLGSGVDSGETGAPVVKLQTGKGAAFQGNEAPAKNQKDPAADSQKNQTAEGVAVGVKKSTTPAAAIESKGKNQTEKGTPFQGNQAPAKNQNDPKADSQRNQTADGVAVGVKKSTTTAAATKSQGVAAGHLVSNLTAPVTDNGGRKRGGWIDGLVGCDMYHGRWVRDDSYPLYTEGSCPHIDEPFDCFRNGRPDRAYQKLRWQTNGCQIPRFNATDMLERLRGKRLVFVGDSLNRNMWESLVCALRHSVKDKNKVFEMSGQYEFRTEGSYSFLFKDYGCTVEYFRTPFLVQEWEMADNNGTKKETLRLDIVEKSASKYKDAYIIVFNTGHWWTHEKTSKGKDYYQEGNHVHSDLNVAEAFHRALCTWAKWVDSNVNPKRTHVFFSGYSVSHFSGGQWNSGGQCDNETEPIKNEAYLSLYPPKMSILEEVIKGMKNPVSYMNVTRMTDYRKDAHPSVYQKPNMTEEEKSPNHIQDCSHWCLPGVPDSWNELLYAEILIKQHQKQN